MYLAQVLFRALRVRHELLSDLVETQFWGVRLSDKLSGTFLASFLTSQATGLTFLTSPSGSRCGFVVVAIDEDGICLHFYVVTSHFLEVCASPW